MAEISQILPFDNFVTFATVDGSIVRRAVEHSLAEGMGGHFADVHGLKFAYDNARPSGNRLVFILADDGNGHYKPLDDKSTYKMAMNDYSFTGGENYNFAGAKDVVNSKIRISEALTRYIRKHKEITPRQHDRIVCVRDGLLSVKDRDGKLVLDNASPGARLSIIGGTGLGVSTVYNAMPVPVADGQILKNELVADEKGHFEHSIADLLKDYSNGGHKPDKIWLCIIAYPPKGSSDNTIITTAVPASTPH